MRMKTPLTERTVRKACYKFGTHVGDGRTIMVDNTRAMTGQEDSDNQGRHAALRDDVYKAAALLLINYPSSLQYYPSIANLYTDLSYFTLQASIHHAFYDLDLYLPRRSHTGLAASALQESGIGS
jgi:hypothetical protein